MTKNKTGDTPITWRQLSGVLIIVLIFGVTFLTPDEIVNELARASYLVLVSFTATCLWVLWMEN